jgi:hypothetical protein
MLRLRAIQLLFLGLAQIWLTSGELRADPGEEFCFECWELNAQRCPDSNWGCSYPGGVYGPQCQCS